MGRNRRFFICSALGSLLATSCGNAPSKGAPGMAHWEILPYDGNVAIVGIDSTSAQSGCMTGGINGRTVDYVDTAIHREERQRLVSYVWDADAASAEGLEPVPTFDENEVNDTRLSQAFGIDVTGIAKDPGARSFSAVIPPGLAGMFVDQIERLARSVDLLYQNEEGERAIVGRAVLTDWAWRNDLALGPTCRALPH